MGQFVEPMDITFHDDDGDALEVYTVGSYVYMRAQDIIKMRPEEARELAERIKKLAATVIMNDPR